ncbi:hypothetical protein QBC36DRAFT_18978 [Triangularia setosa]|uniref:Secreted protein n=1 Tax=Triangularia setosa TaxID=2587417 RepID=A0AAN6W618_9PEZI|nr:hypothetical protein QBC36DRAFT_18978 [Podospora setosa]
MICSFFCFIVLASLEPNGEQQNIATNLNRNDQQRNASPNLPGCRHLTKAKTGTFKPRDEKMNSESKNIPKMPWISTKGG